MNASSDPGDRAPKGAVGAVTTRRANGVPNDPMKPASRCSSSLPVDDMTARFRLANNFCDGLLKVQSETRVAAERHARDRWQRDAAVTRWLTA
jgi:hypothetical protein